MSIKTIDYRIDLTLDTKRIYRTRLQKICNGKQESHVHGQADSIQCIRHELCWSPVPGAVGASARSILQIQGSGLLAVSCQDAGTRCFRRHLYCRRDWLL